MTVRYTPEAIHDLQALRDYIGKILGNPKAASRIAKLIPKDNALYRLMTTTPGET